MPVHLIQRLAQRFAGKCGYVILPKARHAELKKLENYKPSETPLGEHLRQLFGRLNVSCVLDVGANDGAYAESLRRDVGYTGWIHSFEPVPDLQQVLQRKAAQDPRWIIHPYAVGADSGEADLNVMVHDAFSSFLAPHPDQPVKYADCNLIKKTARVPVHTIAEVLPGLLSKYGAGPVYLKTDTQGFDLEVFAGAKPVLSQIVAFQSELSLRPIYKDAPGWLTQMSVFAEAGFVPSYLLPISFDEGLAILEVDGVFVRAPAKAVEA